MAQIEEKRANRYEEEVNGGGDSRVGRPGRPPPSRHISRHNFPSFVGCSQEEASQARPGEGV